MSRRRGLGSGLGGLIAADQPAAGAGLREIPIGAVVPNPHQPRLAFDDAALDELASSIREHGLLQPLVVTELPNGDYQIIAGERRWRALRRAGLSTVAVLIKEASPQQQLELALIENIQRADLHAIEEARAYRALADEFGLTHDQIAQRIGKSRPFVTQMLGLLKLPDEVQQLVASGTLSMGHVRPLMTLKKADAQRTTAQVIAERGLNARQAEALVAQARDTGDPGNLARGAEQRNPEDERVVEDLQTALGVRVQLRRASRGGQLVLYWDDEEMLDALYQRLMSS